MKKVRNCATLISVFLLLIIRPPLLGWWCPPLVLLFHLQNKSKWCQGDDQIEGGSFFCGGGGGFIKRFVIVTVTAKFNDDNMGLFQNWDY